MINRVKVFNCITRWKESDFLDPAVKLLTRFTLKPILRSWKNFGACEMLVFNFFSFFSISFKQLFKLLISHTK